MASQIKRRISRSDSEATATGNPPFQIIGKGTRCPACNWSPLVAGPKYAALRGCRSCNSRSRCTCTAWSAHIAAKAPLPIGPRCGATSEDHHPLDHPACTKGKQHPTILLAGTPAKCISWPQGKGAPHIVAQRPQRGPAESRPQSEKRHQPATIVPGAA